MGEIRSAISAFDHALVLDNKNASALNNRGIAYSLQGNLALAIRDHSESASLFGISSEAGSPLRHIALCYAIRGDINSAFNYLNRAIELNPDSPFNYQTEGLIHLYQGKFEDSIEFISRAAYEQNNSSEIKSYLSLPLVFLGQTEKALSLFKEGLRNPQFPIMKLQFENHLKFLLEIYPDNENLIEFLHLLIPSN
jgi:tetratricopeptide (TPR) repeat protein